MNENEPYIKCEFYPDNCDYWPEMCIYCVLEYGFDDDDDPED